MLCGFSSMSLLGLLDGNHFCQRQVRPLVIHPPLAHLFEFRVGMPVLNYGYHPGACRFGAPRFILHLLVWSVYPD